MHVEEDGKALVKVLDALKDNNTVTDFIMSVDILNPEICRSLSEVLATNKTLSSVSICEYYGILPEQLRVILEGLRCNYTVTHLMVACDPDDVEGVAEMEELLERNRGLLNKAAQFVKGGGDVTDVEGADSLKFAHLRVWSRSCKRIPEREKKQYWRILPRQSLDSRSVKRNLQLHWVLQRKFLS
ncbi:uncharacterized protein LOC144158416 [Haemaphysalis longicornis]